MHDLTRRSLAALFAGSMLFGAAACGDDDDAVDADIDADTEQIEDTIQETGDEIDEEFDENVDIGDDAEQQGGD